MKPDCGVILNQIILMLKIIVCCKAEKLLKPLLSYF